MSSNTEMLHGALPDAVHDASTGALHGAETGSAPPGTALGHSDAALGQTPVLHEGNSRTLRGAAKWAGVSPDTIKRRLKAGAFPGAEMVDGAWRIPFAELRKVAENEPNWSLGTVYRPPLNVGAEPVIDLTVHDAVHDAVPHASESVDVGADTALHDAVHDANEAVPHAELEMLHQLHEAELDTKDTLHAAAMDQVTSNLDRVTAERDRHRSDVDHLRAELERMTAERAEADKQRAVAQALADERADHLTKAEARADDIEHRADALAAERDRVVGLLGWRGRAKYRKTLGPDS